MCMLYIRIVVYSRGVRIPIDRYTCTKYMFTMVRRLSGYVRIRYRQSKKRNTVYRIHVGLF